MDILKILRNGAVSMAGSYVSPRDYPRPDRDGFRRDQAKLIGDVRTVGNDIKKSIGSNVKQAYKSSVR